MQVFRKEEIMVWFYKKNGLDYSMRNLIKYQEYISVTCLLLLFFILGFTSMINKSPAFDETVHLTGGYTALTEKDYRINPENGILPQVWAAIPLIFDSSIIPPDKSDKFWRKSSNWNIAGKFLFKSGNNVDRMFLLSRIMILIAACGTGIAVYFASRQLWGKSGAIISLALFVLSPTLLAHSRFITSDLFSTMFFFLSLWCFQMLLSKFSLFRLTAMSICIACLFLSKMSAPMIIPMILILICIRLYRRKPLKVKYFKKSFMIREQWKQALVFLGSLVFAGFITFVAIWGVFGFRYKMFSDEKGQDLLDKRWEKIITEGADPLKAVSTARNLKLLPEAYLYGFGHVLHESKIRHSFLNGNYSPTGWWYFFPCAFILKTPLPVLLLLFLGIISLLLNKSKARTIIKLKNSSYLFVLIFVYFIFSLSTNLNIGHRHLLVIYPPIFVIAGCTATLLGKSTFRKMVICVIFGILLLENLLIYPDYLTYFTPLSGGPSEGYKHLVDSSLDWGQELKGLKRWIDKNNIPDDKIYISYFGSTDLTGYGLSQKRLLCCFEQNTPEVFPLKEGVYFISATMLQMVYYPEFAIWNEKNENMLIEHQKSFRRLYKSLKDKKSYNEMIKEKPAGFWIVRYRNYEVLRFAKIAYFLRHEKPDYMIGNSILVYQLTNSDIQNIIGREI